MLSLVEWSVPHLSLHNQVQVEKLSFVFPKDKSPLILDPFLELYDVALELRYMVNRNQS